MKLTCNKRTALRILRAIRCNRTRSLKTFLATDLVPPNRGERRHWTSKIIDFSRFGLEAGLDGQHPLDVAVDHPNRRLKMRGAHNTVYANENALPPDSFIDLGDGLAISSPELLFAEMAQFMSPVERLMLGHELCGSYSRNPDDPYNSNVVFNIEPVTTAERIRAFCAQTRWLRDACRPSTPLELLADNAWSPTESLVTALISSPFVEFGYGIGPCILNKRVETPTALAWTTDKSSRVPDILIAGTNIGLNYDGAVHLNLDSIVDAAINLERHPEELSSQIALDAVVRQVRAKAVDDIHRNRELAANGFIVFPIVKEDLYQDGALDYVMAQVIEALEQYAHRDMSQQKRMLKTPLARARRQELIWTLMPGNRNQKTSSLMPRTSQPYERKTEVVVGL